MKSAQHTAQSAERGMLKTPINAGRLSSVVCSADCRSAEHQHQPSGRVSEEKWKTGQQASPLSPSESAEQIQRLIENEQKNRARRALMRAVRRGHLVRPDACSSCHEEGVPQGHHPRGYDDPLDVEWLCGPCHVAAHHPQSKTAHAIAGRKDANTYFFDVLLKKPHHESVLRKLREESR